jgi:hypothetical protein
MATISFSDFIKKSGGSTTDIKVIGNETMSPENIQQDNGGQSFLQETGQDISQIGTDIASSFKTRRSAVQTAKEAQAGGTQSGLETLYQTAGQAAGLVSDVFGSLIKGGVKAALPQGAENAIKSGVTAVAEPIVNTDVVKSVISKYNSLDEKTKRNLEATLGIGSLALDVATAGAGKKVAQTGIETGIRGALRATDTTKSLLSKAKTSVVDTVENFGKKVLDPEVSDATKVSLNPMKALADSGQDITVSINGKLKKLSEVTPDENVSLQMSTKRSLETFDEQAKKFAKDRSVKGGSPVEIVGNRIDRVVDFANKRRQSIGKKMGDIEIKYANDTLPIGENTSNAFIETIKNFDNPRFGVDTADSGVIRKLVKDFDELEQTGSSIGDRLEFIRSWDKYLNDSKDAFGKFKENATVNTRIQNAVKTLKDETVNAVSNKDQVYKQLRTQYRTYKQLDEIADNLLGKDGALGQRIKGAATVKRAVQSNSDAGARQFLVKLKELTGYDAIKEGDLALTAMENVGDYQGLSLLNIVREGKTGLINKGLEKIQDIVAGSKSDRVKRYIKPASTKPSVNKK